MAESVMRSPIVDQTEEEDLFTKYKLHQVEVIQHGLFGNIVLTRSLETPELKRVVKKFTLLNNVNKARIIAMFRAEVKFMQSFDHPYLMKCIFAGQCTKYLAICMHYYERGTLENYVGNLSPEISELCVAQVACALRYMHKNHVAHLDVKLENIFIDSDFNAILGDFGLSRQFLPHQQTLSEGECGGTHDYFAPERKGAQDETQVNPYQLDSYCLGVVLWALIVGLSPDESFDYYMDATNRQGLPAHIRGWLMKLLEKDPSSRPTVTDFLTILRQEGASRHIIDNC